MRISDWSSDVCSSDLGVHRVVDHFAKAGHVLRDAHAHRHLQHFLGQLDHAFHLRGAAGEHHPGAHVLLETRAAQFGLHHLEDLLVRSEEHTSELQSLMRISYAVFCLKKKKKHYHHNHTNK